MRRAWSWVALGALAASMMAGFVGSAPVLAAEAEVPSGFVSGQWFVIAQQAAIGAEFTDFSLAEDAGKDWVVVVADITNTGSDSVFAIDDLELGSVDGGTAGAVAPEKVLPATKFGASKVEADTTVAIADSQTARVVLAYASDDVSEKDAALVLGDQVLPLQRTLVDALDSGDLDKPAPLEIEQATITETDGATLTITTAAGGADTATMAGLAMPSSDGCFGPESSSAVMSLTGGTIWVQDDPVGQGDLVWYWDAAKGGLALLSQALVEQGFAGYGPTGTTVVAPWLSELSQDAKDGDTGLWALCKNAAGTWINEPTPDPSQVRAQYKAIDARDLVIRPGEFRGEKIMVTGTVFNIQVDGNFTGMQIWLDGAPGEAAVIRYYGNSRGIYEGTWITVYGEGSGTFTGTNGFGASIEQPLIDADIIDY